MEDLASNVISPEDVVVSTPAPEAEPSVEEAKAEPEKPLSRRERLEKTFDKIEAEATVAEKPEAAKEAPKVEVKADDKPEEVAAKEAPKPVKTDVEKPQGKQIEPPHRFFPQAKEVWANTPNPVKAEVARLVADHEAEVSQYAESKRFHEELKDYEGMAKQAGTSVKGALDRYVAFDRQLSQDFGKGVAALAQDQGKQPQEVIAHVLRAYGVTPQQYAQMVTQNPQAHQPIAQQQRPAAPQPNAEVAALRQQVQDMERRQSERQLETEVLAPFMADHPRFVELQDDIAMFLKSGKVPTNLSHAERLGAAYDMADRINPAPYRDAPSPSAPVARLVDPDAGTKSITGAPNGGKDFIPPRKPQNRRASIESAWNKLTA